MKLPSAFPLLKPLKERIFFLHFPKCAGLSFFRALSACYGLTAYTSRYSVVYLDANAALSGAQLFGEEMYAFREKLLAYYLAMPRCRCLGGHFPFSEKLFDAFSGQWNFITLLRDPVSAWFSHYAYFLRMATPVHPWFQYADLPLEDFVNTPAATAIGNNFVTMLTWKESLSNHATSDATELALSRLRRFSMIGTVEELGDFAERFESRFAARLRMPHINRARSTDLSRHSCDKRTLEHVRELCEPNQLVYDGVRAILRTP